MVTEHTHALVTRQQVREHLEKALDRMQPASERTRTWGRTLTADQWERLQSKSKGRG